MEITWETFARDRSFSPLLVEAWNDGSIPPNHLDLMLNVLSRADQELFLFEARNFTFRSFKVVVTHWKRLTPEGQESFVQVLDDIREADMEEAARGRVLAYLHGLKPAPTNKII